MNLRLIRIFREVAREESITKAAEKLFISQPAVSTAISQLEDELGTELFDRLSRRIYLNDVGKSFLGKVETFLEMHEELKKSAKELGKKSTIRVGSSITIANFILPEAVASFMKQDKNNRVEVTVSNARTIEELLLNNKIDIGLIEGVISNPELTSKELSSFNIGIFCSSSHPRAGQTLSLEELKDEDFLLREEGSAIRSIFDSTMLLEGIKITPLWISINSQALIKAALSGLGLTVMPEELVKNELKEGSLSGVSMRGVKMKNKNLLVYHKDKNLNKAMEDFIGCLSDEVG